MTVRRPRLGFAGVGWIGRHRLEALAAADVAALAAIADPSDDNRAAALALAPQAVACPSFEALLDLDLDGVVIATPSGLHAEQTQAALARGLAVFCQKPLARTGAEAAAVADAARRADRLLHVDMSYRHVRATRAVRDLVTSEALGRVFAIDLVFHNAYAPDKAWCRDRRLAGGGCLVDLGVHLVDLALWLLDFPDVTDVSSRLYAGGQPLDGSTADAVEDFATARIDLATGATVSIACSWNRPHGADAAIGAVLHGTRAGAAVRNVAGSFFDFRAEHHTGAQTVVLEEGPDAWGGRAAVAWARQLAGDPSFDPSAHRYVDVARVLDRLYAAAPGPPGAALHPQGAAFPCTS